MAVQVYSPPSDVLNGVNIYISELVLLNDIIIVELGNSITMSGSTIRPSTTLVVQSSEYSSPTVEFPENAILTVGGGRPGEYTINNIIMISLILYQ